MSWWQKGVCNSAPNGPIDLKFCMWGSFGRYIWFLFKARSHDLYRGQTCSSLKMRLASLEVIWPWLKQKSYVPPKRSLHAKFQVNWGWVTDNPLSNKPDFAVPHINNYKNWIAFVQYIFYCVKSIQLFSCLIVVWCDINCIVVDCLMRTLTRVNVSHHTRGYTYQENIWEI